MNHDRNGTTSPVTRFNQGFRNGVLTYNPTGGVNHQVEWQNDWGICRASVFTTDWDFQDWDFQVSVFSSTGRQRLVSYFAISFGTIVFPVTLLSVYLLLSTRTKSKSTDPNQGIHEQVA